MHNLRKLALYGLLAGSLIGTSSCSKKDQNVETDYNAKKQSAETLISQINTSMATMKNDHAQWMTTLDQASKKPGADTAKITSYKQQMAKHEGDAQAIMADIDSVKMYSNATSDNADAMKYSDDRLSANFDDLNSKWKSFQDTHESLGKDIQQLAVTTAGEAVKDSAKTAQTQAAAPAKPAAHTTEKKPAVAKPAATPANPHTTVEHHSGGAAKSTHP